MRRRRPGRRGVRTSPCPVWPGQGRADDPSGLLAVTPRVPESTEPTPRRDAVRWAPMRGFLDWYGPRRAAFPWRAEPSPYRTLVSEVMLQQTQAPRVVPHFERFVARYPDLASLASAPRADVVAEW